VPVPGELVLSGDEAAARATRLGRGSHDQFVPFGHGEWLAGRIPGVEARLLDHDGHLTLPAHRVGEVHSWLAEHL
jgi:hypothetical protein